MSWVRVVWSKCILLYVSYMLVQISFFISSIYIVFVFIDPKISTPMNQGRVPHNNLSFHRCIPPSYHNFIKWRLSTLDPVPRPGRPRNFVTMVPPVTLEENFVKLMPSGSLRQARCGALLAQLNRTSLLWFPKESKENWMRMGYTSMRLWVSSYEITNVWSVWR